MADSNDVAKLFVGGISRDTTDITLKDYFSSYGVVSFSVIAKDRTTGLPRGFGFVTFNDPGSVDKALGDVHVVNGRTVEVKRAIPRQPPQQQMTSPLNSLTTKPISRNADNGYRATNGGTNQILKEKKIFVGGLSANLTEEEFKTYFEKFGKITDVVVMHDNNTNRPRGFGFITFESEDVVEKIMQKSHHELGGKRVEVKKAVPREAYKNFNNNGTNNSRFDGGRFVHENNNYAATGNNLGPPLPVAPTYPGYYYNNGCLYGGGYPVGGGYGFFGYGMPVVSLASPVTGVGLMPGRPVNYGTGYYPTGVNGGFPLMGMGMGMGMGMVSPYGGFVDPTLNRRGNTDFRSNGQVHYRNPAPTMNGSRSDTNVSTVKIGKGPVEVKQSPANTESQSS